MSEGGAASHPSGRLGEVALQLARLDGVARQVQIVDIYLGSSTVPFRDPPESCVGFQGVEHTDSARVVAGQIVNLWLAQK